MIEYYKNFSLEPLFYVNEKGLVCQEEWKDIPNWEGRYQASNLGRIKSFYTYKNHRIYKNSVKKRIMMQFFNNKKYLNCHLSNTHKSKFVKVHRLVAKAFIQNPENKPEVNHKDGVKWNNVLDNLEWSTTAENVQHSYDTGLNQGRKGEKHHLSKLTEKQVLEIRQKHKFRIYTSKMLSIEYNISNSTVKRILRRELWTHI